MNKRSILPFSLLFTFIFHLLAPLSFAETSLYTPPFQVDARAAAIYSLEANGTIYQKNADQKMYPASLTKIMTAILVLENVENLNQIVPAKRYIIEDINSYGGAMTAGINPGEELSVTDLLYCTLVQSANDSASILADLVGNGSIPSFVEMMNNKAAELGADNTNYVNPHGLFDQNQYTTANDMIKIMNYAISLPLICEILQTTSYQLPATNIRKPQHLTPTNKMLFKDNPSYYPKLKAAKTGYLEESGRCIVAYASQTGLSYIAVALNCGDEASAHFQQIIELLDWAFESFTVKVLLDKAQPITEIPVKLASNDKDFVLLIPTEDFSAIVPNEIDQNSVLRSFNIPESVRAPIKKGDVIGTVDLILFGDTISTIDLVASESISADKLKSTITDATDFLQENAVQLIVATSAFFITILLIVILLKINLTSKHKSNMFASKKKRRKRR